MFIRNGAALQGCGGNDHVFRQAGKSGLPKPHLVAGEGTVPTGPTVEEAVGKAQPARQREPGFGEQGGD